MEDESSDRYEVCAGGEVDSVLYSDGEESYDSDTVYVDEPRRKTDGHRKHTGRTPKLSAIQLHAIEETIRHQGHNVTSAYIKRKHRLKVSERTIRRAKSKIAKMIYNESRNFVIRAARSVSATPESPEI